MKGGAGVRFFSDFFTPVTENGWPSSASRTDCTSCSLVSSRFCGSP